MRINKNNPIRFTPYMKRRFTSTCGCINLSMISKPGFETTTITLTNSIISTQLFAFCIILLDGDISSALNALAYAHVAGELGDADTFL